MVRLVVLSSMYIILQLAIQYGTINNRKDVFQMTKEERQKYKELTKALPKIFKDKIKKINFRNELIELVENDFNVMYLPIFNVFGNNDNYYLKYPYPNYLQNKTLYKDDYRYTDFNTKQYLDAIKYEKIIVIEIENKGTFIFTNHAVSDVFQILQRHFPNMRSFVFKANNTGGYFKILEKGKIKRKIASYLVMEKMGNNPESRGTPCEYEIENNIVYKVDMKANHLKNMLPNFKKKEVIELFDYYIGLDCLENNKIKNVEIYFHK